MQFGLPHFSIPVDAEGHFDVGKMVGFISAIIDYFAPVLYVRINPCARDRTRVGQRHRNVGVVRID
jgi:hypothetical protein